MIVPWPEQRSIVPISAVLTLGVFDGLHQGHQYLLQQTIRDAKDHGVEAWAVTFCCDPDELFKPVGQTADAGSPTLSKLSSNAQRLERLEQSGLDGVLAIDFNAEMAMLPPDVFLDSVIALAFKPLVLHVGSDFSFGVRASGRVDDLQNWASVHGCTVNAHRLLCDHGQPITSTRIRSLLASGEVAQAADLLTRPYSIRATVVEGRREGTLLGFPTANLVSDPLLARVSDGVYAGLVQLADGQQYPAAISVGVPATFGDLPATTEATLLDYPADAPTLYGQTVTLSYHQFLRPMQAFASIDDLKAAIAHNVAQTRELFGL